jgi:outer membrane protein OmpA-like peptidoglycan-associated protein
MTPLFLLLGLLAPAIVLANDDVVMLHGKIYELTSHKPILADVSISLYYDTDFIKSDSVKTKTGEFTSKLTKMGWYIVTLSSTDYIDTQDTLWVLSEYRPSIEKAFFMRPRHAAGSSPTLVNLELKKKVVLETVSYKPVATDTSFAVSIYFPFAKSELPESAAPGLSALANHLRENPTVALEVFGYTDADGADDYNLMLSQWRAEAVVKYLVNRGVSRTRLLDRGLGKSTVSTVQTKEEKAKNRRVDLIMVNYTASLLDHPKH